MAWACSSPAAGDGNGSGDAGVLRDGDGSIITDDGGVLNTARQVNTGNYLRTALLQAAATPGASAVPEGPVILNGLNLGPLTVASIDSDELTQLNSEALTSNGEVMGDAARQILAYAYSCALPASSSMQLNIGGETWEFKGALGLAPEWETGACDTECQEWVSACILARTNQFGIEVKLHLRGDHPALATSAQLKDRFTLREGSFYGNIFTGADTIDGNAYACAGGAGSAKWEMTKRFCSAIGDGCPITTVADCNITNFACNPDVSGCSSNTACSDWNADGLPTTCYSEQHACGQATAGTSYARVITAYLEPTPRVCGDGFCEENEAYACPADCVGQWTASFGSGCHEDSGGLSVRNGKISTGGRFMGDLSFGGATPTDGTDDRDLFVANMNADGTLNWAISMDSDGEQSMVRAVANDASGNVFVSGHFGGETDLGNGPVPAGAFSLFVAKYAAANGAHIWSKVLTMDRSYTTAFGPDLEFLPNIDMVADDAGGVVLAGGFKGTLDLGPGVVKPNGTRGDDILVARFDASGDLDWHRVLSTTQDGVNEGKAVVGGIDIDSKGDIIVGGRFSRALKIDTSPITLTTDGNTDADGFVAKLSSVDGAPLWARQVSEADGAIGNYTQEVLDVAVGASDTVLVVGSYQGDTSISGGDTFGGVIGTMSNMPSEDSFVAQFDTDGSPGWSTHFGADRADLAQRVAWDGDRSFVVSSVVTSDSLSGTVTVEGTVLDAGENGDIALIRYGIDGSVLSVTSHPTPVTEETKGLEAQGDAVFISGEFMGTLRFGGTYVTNAGGSDSRVEPGDVFVTKIETLP